MPGDTGSELLERAKAGSPEALNLVYERAAGRLLAFIRLRSNIAAGFRILNDGPLRGSCLV